MEHLHSESVFLFPLLSSSPLLLRVTTVQIKASRYKKRRGWKTLTNSWKQLSEHIKWRRNNKKKLNFVCTVSPFSHKSLSSVTMEFPLCSSRSFPWQRLDQVSPSYLVWGWLRDLSGGCKMKRLSEERCEERSLQPTPSTILMSHLSFRKHINLRGAWARKQNFLNWEQVKNSLVTDNRETLLPTGI